MSRTEVSVIAEALTTQDSASTSPDVDHAATVETSATASKKRNADQAELEVDLDAPEPPSKKALRKAKKSKSSNSNDAAIAGPPTTSIKGAEDVVPNSGKRSDYGVWIGNLAFTTTKQDLVDFMTSDVDYTIEAEKLTRINLPAGPAKHGKFQNKGFAYVDLADAAALSKALELSEKLLGGRRVLIKDAKSYEGRPKEKKEDVNANPPSKRLFVGNLAFDTTAEDLENHFGVCGNILNTHVATFEDSGKCKGYAWIEFEQLPSSQAAMRGWVEEGKQQEGFQGKKSDRRIWLHKMAGRKLRLEYAEDKAIRYQKRFGKESQKSTGAESAIQEVTEEFDTKFDQRPVPPTGSDLRRNRDQKRDGVRTGGYAKDTVKRMTGAIVEGQGSKVTFD